MATHEMLRATAGLLASLALAGCADDGGPRLTAVMPAAAPRNATVTLIGTRLCGASGACVRAGGEVLLGIEPPQVQAPVTGYSDTTITIVIPTVAPSGTSMLSVTVNDQSSNALAFEVLP